MIGARRGFFLPIACEQTLHASTALQDHCITGTTPDAHSSDLSCTVMLHQGQVVLDVSGDERARMDVPDLLALFERTRGEKVSDDALLLLG